MRGATDPSEIRAALRDDGYVVQPLLDPARLKELRDLFGDLGVDEEVERWASAPDLPHDEARAVDLWLQSRFADVVDAALPGFAPFLGTYFAKGARRGTEVAFHQDWTYTDEHTHRAVLVWAPLVDADESNGTMVVVPGSHRWSTGIRPSHDPGVLPPDAHRAALRARSRVVPLRAGQALLFDPALIHSTPPNVTDQLRAAAGVVLKTADAAVVHFRIDQDGHLVGYRLPPDRFYLDAFLGMVEGLDLVDPWAPRASADDLRPFLS